MLLELPHLLFSSPSPAHAAASFLAVLSGSPAALVTRAAGRVPPFVEPRWLSMRPKLHRVHSSSSKIAHSCLHGVHTQFALNFFSSRLSQFTGYIAGTIGQLLVTINPAPRTICSLVQYRSFNRSFAHVHLHDRSTVHQSVDAVFISVRSGQGEDRRVLSPVAVSSQLLLSGRRGPAAKHSTSGSFPARPEDRGHRDSKLNRT